MTATMKTSFGVFKGKKGDGVTQYLGVKYANLKDRLAVPELVKQYSDVEVDASEYGPRTISMEACLFEQDVLIQQRTGEPKPPPMSGLECLNLNITVPELKGTDHGLLPVIVFIHGGGYIIGGNWWPQYDPARLVKLSAERDYSIIAVNINYRLAVLGNLTSQELRNAGYPGNNSLRDQKCALQWIKAHIMDFGGDHNNVTCFGESAGAAAVLTQLFSEEPLFKRAISMSGTPIMLKPLPPPVAEVSYQTVMKELGLENASVEERIERLTTIDADELVSKTPMTVALIPFLDGDMVPSVTTLEKISDPAFPLPGREWCTELMLGDCKHDGNVFMFMGLAQRKSGIASAFATSLAKHTSATIAEAVLKAYQLTPGTDDDSALRTILDYATDISYYAPALAYSRHWPGKTYAYHFNEPCPWDGAFKGYVNHMLDAAFLFQNYNDKLEPDAERVAVALAEDFIGFANGIPACREFNNENGVAGGVRTYGPSSDSVAGWLEDGGDRRDTLFRLKEEADVDLDVLSGAWDLFVAGL
ncbi:para-nitrobenzyl esterase [Amniculicola lignicola CBS 123094]|uniref:Para-nitrobenzyl esterase n=1 Tax=Amniculicola lignicola CBS 123094 TaxID=1392246 RepID=A0A6A5WJL2_9PLEO|nr:para-nitrobenzyl esterase [Amniculicola lignicola CBS 123094]